MLLEIWKTFLLQENESWMDVAPQAMWDGIGLDHWLRYSALKITQENFPLSKFDTYSFDSTHVTTHTSTTLQVANNPLEAVMLPCANG